MFRYFSFLLLLILVSSCNDKFEKTTLLSPNNNIKIEFFIGKKGKAFYSVAMKNDIIIKESSLGFETQPFLSLANNFEVLGLKKNIIDNTWELPWGEQRFVKNKYNEVIIKLQNKNENKTKLNIIFRVFDDGVAFRYNIPKHVKYDTLIIKNENTYFNLVDDNICWWIPGDWDSYEHLYNKTPFSKIDAISKRNHPNLASSYIPYNAVNTPFTMKTSKGIYLSFHEADLTDYPGMTLKVDTLTTIMKSELVAGRNAIKAKVSLPFFSPWRTIQISENPTELIESKMILNLNKPNEIGDVSWIKPLKYLGIWWQMHIGTWSWDYGTGKHGATTANAIKMIDFAAKNNIGGLLIEGWNQDWKKWYSGINREKIFSFTKPYPDYNLNKVAKYAKTNNIELIMHHETASAPRAYEQQLDSAFSLMRDLDIHYVKTGYVGNIVPEGEHHHGQWMVRHYRKVLETAVKYKIAVNIHEPIKQTGLRRTFPNLISSEGLRGQEFNAWSKDGGNPPEHITNIAFTRMLAGPIDYTPGIFNLEMKPYKNNRKINTTLSHQLALYVVVYSPIQMVPDYLDSYKNHPAFQFIKDVPTDWEKTIVLNGEIGNYVTIARKSKNTNRWFVGSITDEFSRVIKINFDFLDSEKDYTATVYRDTKKSNYDSLPDSYIIESFDINKFTQKEFYLAPGGGFAISINKKNGY